MKKYILLLSLVAGFMALTSCDPKEDNTKSNLKVLTPDQIDAEVIVEKIDGKSVNKVSVSNHTPLPSKISNGVNNVASAYAELLLFNTGDNTVTVYAMNPDGTEISRDYSVNVDEMYYEVPKEYALLCGSGEKVWRWDDSVDGTVWGNCGYLSDSGGSFGQWWGTDVDDIANQASNYGYTFNDSGSSATMTFILNGLRINKSSGGQGTFNFDMDKTTPNGDGLWSIGKLYTTGESVLFPIMINAGTHMQEYDIMTLDEGRLYLTVPSEGAGAWGEATFWRFRADQ